MPDILTHEGALTAENLLKRRRKAILTRRLVRLAPVIACVSLGAMYLLAAASKGYNIAIGLQGVVSDACLVALVATGATFIFSSGSFDLSLGSNMLISAIVGGIVCKKTEDVPLAALVCIAVAVSLSVLNSVLASFFNLPVFIMTIVMMNVYSSVATLMITLFGTNAKISVPMRLVAGLNTTFFRLLLLAAFEIFCCFLFYFTKLGRKERFLGGNPVCARLSGINAKKLTILSFALAGIGIGLASFAMIVETPTLSSSSGSTVGMNMLIALVFGGMNMNGGPESRMYSALLGAFSMAFLDSFMNIFVTGSWYLQIVKGALFVAVVTLFSVGNRSRTLKR